MAFNEQNSKYRQQILSQRKAFKLNLMKKLILYKNDNFTVVDGESTK